MPPRKTKKYQVDVEMTVRVTVEVFENTKSRAVDSAMFRAKEFINQALPGHPNRTREVSPYDKTTRALMLHFHGGTEASVMK